MNNPDAVLAHAGAARDALLLLAANVMPGCPLHSASMLWAAQAACRNAGLPPGCADAVAAAASCWVAIAVGEPPARPGPAAVAANLALLTGGEEAGDGYDRDDEDQQVMVLRAAAGYLRAWQNYLLPPAGPATWRAWQFGDRVALIRSLNPDTPAPDRALGTVARYDPGPGHLEVIWDCGHRETLRLAEGDQAEFLGPKPARMAGLDEDACLRIARHAAAPHHRAASPDSPPMDSFPAAFDAARRALMKAGLDDGPARSYADLAARPAGLT